MTGVVVDLAGYRARHAPQLPVQPAPLNLCDAPIISAVCASLTRAGDEQPCAGLLAYQNGAWQHVNTCWSCLHGAEQPCGDHHQHQVCDDPQPQLCAHDCGEPADLDQACAYGHQFCDGCCWAADDQPEGGTLWPR